MVQNSGRWRSSDKHRAFIPIIVVVALMAIGAAVFTFLRSAGPVSTATAQILSPSALSGWRMDCWESKRQSQHFDGSYRPGQVFYIPAGTIFWVKPEPRGVTGMFVEKAGSAEWDHAGGELNPGALNKDVWEQQCRAPNQPGLYRLEWKSDAGVPAFLDVLVLSAAEAHVQGERTSVKVNGKSIGSYLDPAQSTVRRVRENAAQYRVPEFFATLTPETIPLKLGPDFDLGQLVAFKDYHGPDGRKVYTTIRHTDVLAIHPQLIDKLVKLRERLRSKGVKVTKFWITSGFRTPDYNKSIGGAAYSRHCYGDAVDLCIDEDDDKKMDDLNGDGRIDRKDGVVIGNACRELELEGAVVPGGIGVYEWQAEDSVGSHVHIDCRSYISRWGQIGAGKTKRSFLWWPKAEFQEDDGE